MAIRDLDDYELIVRWRSIRVDAALNTDHVAKRFINAYMDALTAEMDRRCPQFLRPENSDVG